MGDISPLPKVLGVAFKDSSLLEQALIHSSYINENPNQGLLSNERLEFLGDAVLDFLIAEKLYQDFPSLTEGEMTSLRAALVRQETLARIAGNIRLGEYLRLGRGEEASGGRSKPANLARALEALVAAVFLDRGLTVTRKLVLRLFREELEKVISRGRVVDYKSQLQELIQSKYKLTPSYQIVEAEGPEHAKRFTVEVMVGGEVLGRGSGKSKKLAETEAARAALTKLGECLATYPPNPLPLIREGGE